MFDWCFKTVRGRFLTTAGLFFALSSLALTSFHFFESRATLLGELEKRGYFITENFVFRSAHSLEEKDLATLREEVRNECVGGDVRYVIVQDPDGQVLAEQAAGGVDLASIRQILAAGSWKPDHAEGMKLRSAGKAFHNFSAPVWTQASDGTGRSRLATVRIGYSPDATLSHIERVFWLSLTLWLVMCGLGFAGIFLVTRWALLPIAHMAEAARSIASGDLTQRVRTEMHDEIGELGDAMNDMTRSLDASRRDLDRRNAELHLVAREKEKSYLELKETQERLAHSESTRRAEKLRSVGQMASGVAHDFNNILSVICGRVQLLKMKAVNTPAFPSDFMKALEIIERAALDGGETVRRIQEFSRDRQGQEMQRGDVNHMVREVVETTRPRWKNQTESNGVRVDVVMKLSRVPQIACVASEVREVLTNLIFNAVDAMPDGGTITVATETYEGGVCLRVVDSGTGMPPEVRERIFEPFFTTKGDKGNGLGLAMVYGIIQRHGGEITVAPGATCGTEFRIVFPAAAGGGTETILEKTMQNRPIRVLIADDEFNVRRALAELLIALGHEVVEAHDGRDALEKFGAGSFDMVFTDLGMPDLSGWDVAEKIRWRDMVVPIVLVTGWGNQIAEEEARARNVTRVMAKPFTLQKVSSTIAELQGLAKAA